MLHYIDVQEELFFRKKKGVVNNAGSLCVVVSSRVHHAFQCKADCQVVSWAQGGRNSPPAFEDHQPVTVHRDEHVIMFLTDTLKREFRLHAGPTAPLYRGNYTVATGWTSLSCCGLV